MASVRRPHQHKPDSGGPATQSAFWLGWGLVMVAIIAALLFGLPGGGSTPDTRAESPPQTRAVH